MVFFSLLSQLKLVFGALVILLVWHMLKQLFLLLCVKVVDFTSSPVNNYHEFFFVGFWGMKSFRYFLEVSSSSCANLLVGESGCKARFVSILLLCFGKVSKMVEVKFSFSNGNNCWKRKLFFKCINIYNEGCKV